MSDKYINANDLRKRRQGCKNDCKSCDFWKDGDSWCNGQLFVVDLLHAPAADVRPNVTGRWELLWIADYDLVGDGYTVPQCSVCKEESYAETPYCPNCGAQMMPEEAGE